MDPFTERKTTSILISTVIKMQLDLSDGLVSSVYNKQGATASNVKHIKIIRKFCIFTCPINMAPSAPFTSSNCCNPYMKISQPYQQLASTANISNSLILITVIIKPHDDVERNLRLPLNPSQTKYW